MRTFTYEAREESGELAQGTRAGESAEAVARQLKAEGYIVVSVEPTAAPPRAGPWDWLQGHVLRPVFWPVSSKSLAMFFSQVRVLLSTGMNLSEAMRSVSGRTSNPEIAAAAREIAEGAVRGRPMSQVIARHRAAFRPMTLSVIQAGEESGQLELTAGRLATYFDRAFQLEQTYRWQTFYPKLLIAAVILIPTARTLLFEGFMPWLILVLSRALPLLVAVALAWYGFRALMQIPPVRRAFDGFKLSLPWFGSLSRRLSTARWARALSMLLAAGVPMHRALVGAAAASGNGAMEEGLVREAEATLHGKTVSEVLCASRVLPEMATDMLSTAERAGSYEEALDRIADYYESETDVGGRQTAVVVGLLFYLIVAAVIFFIVFSFWSGYFGRYTAMLE
jgi:type II secretory pathway component PulF